MAFFSRSDDLAGYAEADAPRESLLPPSWTEALRRRAAELAGLALLVVAAALMAALGSYNPADPSFFNATSAAPANWLGLTGATLADPMARALGVAAWAPPALLGLWGGRLLLHVGEARVWSRLALAPFAVLAAAACLSAHVPPEGWAHPYGLGGLGGDSLASMALTLVPLPPAAAILPLTLALTAAAVALGGLALGLDRAETSALAGWLGGGLVWALGGLAAALGLGVGALSRRRTPPAEAAPAPSLRRAAPYEDDEPPLSVRAPSRAAAGRGDPVIDADADADDAEAEPPSVLDRIRAVSSRPAPAPVVPAPAAAAPAQAEPALSARAAPAPEAEPQAAPVATPRVIQPAPAPAAAAPAPAEPAAPSISRVEIPTPARRASARAEPAIWAADAGAGAYSPPPLDLLQDPRGVERPGHAADALDENARMLEEVLDDYGIRGEIAKVSPGPVVTMYELEPERGVKASRVIGLADDIARSMSALAARVSTVPGRSVIGIELPNDRREKVVLREILESPEFGDAREKLLLALGKDIAGLPVVANLARMPHLLIAGTTGSGKSVAINTMILSLLYRLSPKECRMIMIDPKMLELSVYDGIPHLLSPVVTDPKKAVVALKWVVAEMEDRYRKMSRMGVRNIEGYNARVLDAQGRGEAFTRTVQTGFCEDTGEPVYETEEFAPEALPLIVVVVDEMADLMMVAGKEIEACIQRLAQMARASGIHLIMATQRPSVDVITGTIKANFPTRISFQVTSKIDSRTILGEQGAEQLLGMGDMLYMAGGGRVTRIHGPFVSDEEVEEVVRDLKAQGEPSYVAGVTDGPDEEMAADVDLVLGLGGDDGSDEQLYDRAVAIVARDRKCSTSYIQRKLAIGYNKAARIVEMMETQGVVSPADKVGKREIMVGEI